MCAKVCEIFEHFSAQMGRVKEVDGTWLEKNLQTINFSPKGPFLGENPPNNHQKKRRMINALTLNCLMKIALELIENK